MKKTIICVIAAVIAVNLSAQQKVDVREMADKVISKALEGIDPGQYQGSVFNASLTEYALASGDKVHLDRVKAVLDLYKDKKVPMAQTSNFIGYRYGGNAAARMAYSGYNGYSDMIREAAADAWKNQRRTATEGLMTGQYTRPHQPDVFFVDVISAVTPFVLYAGLLEGNKEYIDYAAWETLEAYRIFKDSESGLFHQSRGTYDIPMMITQDCWSRGNGWASTAFSALMRHLPKNSVHYKEMRATAKAFYTSVLKYQDPKTGLWHQEMTDSTSYIETSGSGLLLDGIAAAIESGVLPKKHKADFYRGLQGLLSYVDPDGSVGHTCRGCLSPGTGTKADYIDRQFYFNESHAFGPVVSALAAALRLGYTEIELPVALGSANDVDRPATYVRFIEERKEDFAWENDLAAFRIYSRFAGDGTASGVDFWAKSVDYPIVDQWYANNANGLSYHKDHGQGADFYNVGKGRGTGGTGVWVDGKLYCSKNYASYKIVRNDRDKIEFILYYQPFKAGNRIIQETKRIEMVLGTNFYKISATFEAQDGKEVVAVVGLTTFGAPAVVEDPSRGLLWVDEKLSNDPRNSSMFSAVAVDPDRLVKMIEYENDRLALFRAGSGEEVEFFAGAGWCFHQNNGIGKRSNEYRSKVSWKQLMEVYAGTRPSWEFPYI